MAENQSNTAHLITTAAETTSNVVDAAHMGAAAMAVGSLKTIKDVIGIANFGIDLAQVTVDDLIDHLTHFIETGERPT